MAAADGFRLAVETGSLSSEMSEEISIIVPAKTFSEIESENIIIKTIQLFLDAVVYRVADAKSP